MQRHGDTPELFGLVTGKPEVEQGVFLFGLSECFAFGHLLTLAFLQVA
jgi:hypothetical protein